jgi:hypothetical protein
MIRLPKEIRMSFRFALVVSVVVTTATLAGCGTAAPTADNSKPAAAPDPRFVLAEEPADAKPVIDVRQDAKDGDNVTITGRIGGDVDPWVEGRATFVIVDPSLTPCSEREGDTCKTPWDYCCDLDRLADSKATIKVVDDQGQTVATDARKLLGVKELQTVIVRGQAKRDEAGNLTVLASKIYVKPE